MDSWCCKKVSGAKSGLWSALSGTSHGMAARQAPPAEGFNTPTRVSQFVLVMLNEDHSLVANDQLRTCEANANRDNPRTDEVGKAPERI